MLGGRIVLASGAESCITVALMHSHGHAGLSNRVVPARRQAACACRARRRSAAHGSRSSAAANRDSRQPTSQGNLQRARRGGRVDRVAVAGAGGDSREETHRLAPTTTSLPALAGDKTRLRSPAVFDRLRRLGPRIHPLAEVTLGQTGWAKWVADGNGSWYDAGVEFRRRMGPQVWTPREARRGSSTSSTAPHVSTPLSVCPSRSRGT